MEPKQINLSIQKIYIQTHQRKRHLLYRNCCGRTKEDNLRKYYKNIGIEIL